MSRTEILRLAELALDPATRQTKDYAEMIALAEKAKAHFSASFPITSVCRDDFKDMSGGSGYDPSSLDDGDMEQLADTLQDALVNETYWQVLEEFAEEKGLPALEADEEEEEVTA